MPLLLQGSTYCNSLLYGQPKCILKRLQSVLNSAARLIHLTSRYEHVTPLLIQLHWLPIEQRITFKIAVAISLISSSLIHLVDFLDPLINFYFLHLNLILKLMVAGILLLLHLLFGMHFHSNLDLVILLLLLNLRSRLGFLKLFMMLSYRIMMFFIG